MATDSPILPVRPLILIRSCKNFSKEAISKISSSTGSVQSIVNLLVFTVLGAPFLDLVATFGFSFAATLGFSSLVAAAAKAPKASSAKKAGKKAPKRVNLKYTIDASEPAADEIFDISSFEKFLHDRIKIGGKTGVLGEQVTITREGSVITVQSKVALSKRYLKYLTKKFLKKQVLRDYIRVIARTKNGYFLRYFNFHNEEEEAEE